MKRITLILVIGMLLSSCNVTIPYTVYIPSQNRFVEMHHKESPFGAYDYRAGDTVLYNGVKAVIVAH